MLNIICPQCGFSREVNPDQFEGKETVIAICPKCACRFRVSPEKGVLGIVPPKGWKVLPKAQLNKPQEEPQEEPEKEQQEEEDIRQIAKRAYEQEAERFSREEKEEPIRVVIPWEQPGGNRLEAFYQTVVGVMFAAPLFFQNLGTKCLKSKPFSFYMIVVLLQCIMEGVWGYAFYNFFGKDLNTDPQLQEMIAMLAPGENYLFDLVLRCGMLALKLYVFTLLMFFMFRLVAPGRGTFDLIFQIIAYSSAPAILCIVPVLGSIAGLFWSIGCLAVGLKSAMQLNWPQTLAGFIPLVLLYMPIISILVNKGV